jgi:ribosomal protein S12 methylthiotransferase
MPLQHISDKVLDAMNRRTTRAEIMETLDRVKRKLPDAALRTTFVVGHPGETDAAFDELLAFVSSGVFDLVGAFEYSREPGTLSAKLNDNIPADVKSDRRERLMEAALSVARKRTAAMAGQRQTILLDAPLDKESGKAALSELRRRGVLGKADGRTAGEVWVGRSQREAPEIDGAVIILPVKDKASGEFVDVDIIGAMDYDRLARVR